MIPIDEDLDAEAAAAPDEEIEVPEAVDDVEVVEVDDEPLPEREYVGPISEPVPVRQRWLVVGGAALAVAIVVFAAFSFVQWRRADDRAGSLASDRDQRRAAATAAGAFGQALLSYDYADLGAARERVLALATDTFATTYDEAFVSGLEPLITDLQAVAEAQVRDVYVTELSGESAAAVVVLDSEVRSTTGTRRLLGTYLQMDLVREAGDWKIDAVTAISAVEESLTPPAGETTTTTATTVPSG